MRRQFDKRQIAVAGHTDSKGTDDYNMGLSEKRANAIKDYLVSKLVLAPVSLFE
jgi:outer membrane protein OmpA-like peptidoglycan-associated protein